MDRDISHLSLDSQIRIDSSFIDLRNILLQQPGQTGSGPHLYGTIGGTDKIGLLPFRIAVGGLLLLPHIRPDQDHERQAHRQPDELDGGVQLVAGEEFQVTFHIFVIRAILFRHSGLDPESFYSFFSSMAGLVRAALRVCQRMERKATIVAMRTVTTNTHP